MVEEDFFTDLYLEFIVKNLIDFVTNCFNPLFGFYEEEKKIKEVEDIELELFWKKKDERIILKYENDDYMFVVTNMTSILLESIDADIRHYYEGNFNLNKYQIQEMKLIINNHKENSKYEMFYNIIKYLSLLTSNNITDLFTVIINRYDTDFIENNCCIEINEDSKEKEELESEIKEENNTNIIENTVSHSKKNIIYDDDDFILI